MNQDRLEALLWARIDGTIDPEELAELEAHLAEQPEPRKIDRQITAIASGLEELETVQPPSELRGRIDSALENAAPPTPHTTVPFVSHAAPSRPARWLPLAACLLIGVAIGYLMHPGVGGSIDRAEVTGSMLTPTEQMESAPVEIALNGGRVVASRSGADIVVDLTLTTEVELGVTLAGAKGPVRLASLNSTTSQAIDVSTTQGWLVLQTRGPGTVALALSMSTPGDPLRIQVSADGLPTEEHWLGPSRIDVRE